MAEISGSSQADALSGFGDKIVFSDELAAGLEEAYMHLEFQLSSLVIPLW